MSKTLAKSSTDQSRLAAHLRSADLSDVRVLAAPGLSRQALFCTAYSLLDELASRGGTSAEDDSPAQHRPHQHPKVAAPVSSQSGGRPVFRAVLELEGGGVEVDAAALERAILAFKRDGGLDAVVLAPVPKLSGGAAGLPAAAARGASAASGAGASAGSSASKPATDMGALQRLVSGRETELEFAQLGLALAPLLSVSGLGTTSVVSGLGTGGGAGSTTTGSGAGGSGSTSTTTTTATTNTAATLIRRSRAHARILAHSRALPSNTTTTSGLAIAASNRRVGVVSLVQDSPAPPDSEVFEMVPRYAGSARYRWAQLFALLLLETGRPMRTMCFKVVVLSRCVGSVFPFVFTLFMLRLLVDVLMIVSMGELGRAMKSKDRRRFGV